MLPAAQLDIAMDHLSLVTLPKPLRKRHSLLVRLLALLVRWHLRARGRRQLQQLDGRALADLGLNQADQYREGSKPFWRE
ncbi:hypothetical protein thsps117_03300 [Pseudomonas sp. No.117]